MEKFCVFCGKKPESKSHEHVVPQWLMKLTGDPNREVFLGLKWTSPTLDKRRFSFKALTFPACEECNNRFSTLEAQAQVVVETILERGPLGAGQWDTFFDWLDKIRTGIWLGWIYLNQNYRGLRPLFHIGQRIASKDRLVIIYEIQHDGQTGVMWSGTEDPLFQHMPSCFALTINNFVFFNTSYDFLFSRRFGFPYPSKREFRAEGGIWIEMAKGLHEPRLPLLKRKFKTGGTQLFQPMIPYEHFRTTDDERVGFSDFYNHAYVKSNCMDFAVGRGKIFRANRKELVIYPEASSREWIPKQNFPRGEVTHQVAVMAAEFLEELFQNQPSFGRLSEEDCLARKAEIQGAVNLHRTILDHFIKQKDRYY